MSWRTCFVGHVDRMGLFALVLLACAPGRPTPAARPAADAGRPEARAVAASEAEPRAGHFVIRGAEVVGVGVADVEVKDGRIAAIGAVAAGPPALQRAGRWIVPAAIDSHVHLSYLPGGRRMLDGGVAAAVDLAAPLAALREGEAPSELMVLPSGPMITARGGYPTRDWGSDGYGLEVDGPAAATEAVEALAAAGAKLIKVPVTDAPTLPPATLKAIVTAAHARGLKVAAHALFDRHARAAAEAGVDLLAHVPVEPLQARTVEAWAGRAAISTLSAFGGAAVENLKKLRAAGVTVLYGTDFGNTQLAGISGEEIDLLVEAGLDGQAIVTAMTSAPAQYWGLDSQGPGVLVPGGVASFLIVTADPRATPSTLAEPEAVFIAGTRR
ncbi:amidohydrolase family protein [Nannocystis pusilla]|uniref:amidohydrolase family protein n=1 Tax=Nannocystis pusilla TaxID=889268 RepID=UPI003DA4E9F1